MIIFLDMDGVCCDFVTAALQAHGVTKPVEEFWTKGEWHVEKILGISAEQFWNPIHWAGAKFWENLEPYPHMKGLINLVSGYEFFFLTSPSRDPECLSGKKRWLEKHGLAKHKVIYTSEKWLLAGHDRILIDDSDSNCRKFEEHGGEVFKVPAPWNSIGCFPDDNFILDIHKRVSNFKSLLSGENR